MGHVIEQASSARAKCRGCGERIAKGELRLGEKLPNPFAEGEMTHWYHLVCASYKRPEPLLEALDKTAASVDAADGLRKAAQHSLSHRRLPRVNGGQRAPTGRARCRSCKQTIDKDAWRIPLVFYEEGRFQPSGFVHVRCAQDYFETTEILDRVKHFSPDLEADDLEKIGAELCGRASG